ncbi:MAG TPA: hypothetical protein VFT74_14595, partial [Isosphaeraceae bacterium]|nr:hypothetical protein [Isosphaeraceae bacterium]
VQVTRDWLSDRAGRIWYVGYFTFAFYAENRGMSRLTPGQTTLHQGDWLVYPDFDHVYHEPLRLHPQDVEKLASISLKDPLPVQTILNFYSGLSGLLHRNNTHLTVEIYRARHDFTPQQR